jgi:hypothetical protein
MGRTLLENEQLGSISKVEAASRNVSCRREAWEGAPHE